jgi:hypothetical protein
MPACSSRFLGPSRPVSLLYCLFARRAAILANCLLASSRAKSPTPSSGISSLRGSSADHTEAPLGNTLGAVSNPQDARRIAGAPTRALRDLPGEPGNQRSDEVPLLRKGCWRSIRCCDSPDSPGCGPTRNRPAPTNLLALLDRLEYVRGLGIDAATAKRIHPARLSRLLAEAAVMTVQRA